MKTIVENESKLSKYIFDDNTEITFESDRTITPKFIISDLNSSNATLFESVTPPEDWIGNKYTFDNGAWELNPNWIDPSTLTESPVE